MKANPDIKVDNTLVAYEALHDKIVTAAPAGTYDVVLMDSSGRPSSPPRASSRTSPAGSAR